MVVDFIYFAPGDNLRKRQDIVGEFLADKGPLFSLKRYIQDFTTGVWVPVLSNYHYTLGDTLKVVYSTREDRSSAGALVYRDGYL